MTTRQRILKFIYPLFAGMSKLIGKNAASLSNAGDKEPPVPFYSLSFTGNDGKEISFKQYRGKKVMLVNTASFCGYTSQYDALEKLYRDYKDKLVILGFPANDFGEQEPGADKEIEQFCRLNYGVSFPLFKKSSVLKPGQNPVYSWLTDSTLNGWNNRAPAWNFNKYVINEKGRLTHVFGSAIEPFGPEIKKAIN